MVYLRCVSMHRQFHRFADGIRLIETCAYEAHWPYLLRPPSGDYHARQGDVKWMGLVTLYGLGRQYRRRC